MQPYNRMQSYAGVKIVHARPMTRTEYNGYRGWELPADEQALAHEPGMLVEYLQSGTPNMPNHEGYVTWSPMAVFVRAYKSIESLPFGVAVELLRGGFRVQRADWNGKDMFLQYVDPYAPHPLDLAAPDELNPGNINSLYRSADNNGYAPGTMLPWIGMKTADNKFIPWTASQSDILATDWTLYDLPEAV